jgi:hypothetical protein
MRRPSSRGPLALAAAALAISAPGPARADDHRRPEATTRLHPAHVVPLGPGSERHRFTLRRPAGVVLLFRLTLPRGTRAYLTGRIGDIAGVGMTTDARGACTPRGPRLVCRQSVEWCPLPRGTWAFRLHKLGGPAGTARLEFVVGAPPA